MSDFGAALKRMRKEMPEYVYVDAATEVLGEPGRMLSPSKSAPVDQDVYWNACVFNAKGQQVWHGDFNLTRDRSKLDALAARIGVLYLTPEQPFRFKGLKVGRAERSERVIEVRP